MKAVQHTNFNLRSTAICLTMSILILLSNACKVNYSMTGASISPDVKTIDIRYFQKTAALGPSNLSQTFTEKLKDKFLTGTSLSLTNSSGDLTLEGSITSYNVSPQAIQSNEVDEKQNFETTFSRYADFQSNININSIEEQLITEINEQLADDIFNKAVINW